jgi:hypothetical protein
MRQVMLHGLPHLPGAHTSSRKPKTPSPPTRVITFRLRGILRHGPRPNERVPGTLDHDQLRTSDFGGQSADF